MGNSESGAGGAGGNGGAPQPQPPLNPPPAAVPPPSSSSSRGPAAPTVSPPAGSSSGASTGAPSSSSGGGGGGGNSSAFAGASAYNSNLGLPMTSPPGAYKMPGQPRNQRFYVTIPRGVRPGQHFAVLVNGQQMMVRCPEGNRQGDRLIVTAPRQQSQQYVVTVPANVKPGQQFRVMINSQEVMVTCPRGVRSGQRVTFQLPQQERGPQAAPNHQMFEVTVPDGVKAGQPFALIANGQRVMVTCPPNVKPGQKIRFQLPIQLSQQQLEAIRVNYDKVGAADMGMDACVLRRAASMSLRPPYALATHSRALPHLSLSLPPCLAPAPPPIGRTAGCAAWARTSSSTGCTTSQTPLRNRHVSPFSTLSRPVAVLLLYSPHQASVVYV